LSCRSSAVVCRADYIDGCKAEYDKATTVLGTKTSDIDHCEVYITIKGDYVYAHSNFITPGYDRPTKLLEHKTLDFGTIALNLVSGHQPSYEFQSRILSTHKTKIKYYLDQSVFDQFGRCDLDFAGAHNLYVDIADSPPPKALLPTRSSRGPPWMVEIQESVCLKLTDSCSPSLLNSKLSSLNFSKDRLRLVSLVDDSATRESIERSPLKSRLVALDTPSIQSLEEAFRSNQENTMVLLGHAEDDRFVGTDAWGRKTFEMPFAEIEASASRHNCDVIYMGCNSGRATVPIGTTMAFNPIDAVSHLAESIDCTDYSSFIKTLASKDLAFVGFLCLRKRKTGT
jgi:hypothetical protein